MIKTDFEFKRTIIASGVILLIFSGAFLIYKILDQKNYISKNQKTVQVPEPVLPPDRIQTVIIPEGSVFSKVIIEAGVSSLDAEAVYVAAKASYDLAAVRAGRTINLAYDPSTNVLKKLVYPINDIEELQAKRTADGSWIATRESIKYEIRQKTARGKISSSLYAAGLEVGMDERAIIDLADVFQWTVDFAQDVRVDDTFSVIYEERWRDGFYVMPGRVLAAEYVNDGEKYRAFVYQNEAGIEGYYDESGGSLRKMFLKAPVAFKYITSSFTTGLRYVSAFNVSTGHRAIDYAASKGTPIRATADGTVTFAGWGGAYGNKVTIRHNGTYTTNYGHQSRIAVKKGQKVTQGQVIGYVGSTGFSTGPHLHYEMVKNGTRINPLREKFPGTDPLAESEKLNFQKTIEKYGPEL